MFSEEFQNTFKTYIKITKENEKGLEKVNDLSAQFSKSIVRELSGQNSTDNLELYEELFALCGRLIHIGDHLIDVEKDLFTGQYNQLVK